jgi:Domain of unknown function (DUF4396)
MFPVWLHWIAIVSLVIAAVVAVWTTLDVVRRPQHMAIMNVVWPVTALYGGVMALWFYMRHGRAGPKQETSHEISRSMGDMHHRPDRPATKPFAVAVAIGATHCGAGCTLGDIIAETLAFAFPAIAIWFGWKSLFSEKMFAVWILDFILAFALGILFQYFAIAPMRGLSFRDGIVAALKADTLSLTAWQIGMYGLMAIAQFAVVRPLLGLSLEPDTVEFWFVMQLAMMAGFVTSYPVNWWLIRAGIKEEM